MKKKHCGKHTRERFKGKINKKKLAVLFIILIVFVFCVINILKDGEKNEEIIENSIDPLEENIISNEVVNEIEEDEIVDVDMPDKIENYKVLGQIVIDKIDAKNYILNKTTEYSLNLDVTKFYGPDLNERGNFCITGHNARGLFNNLKKLEIGDTFYIIDKENSAKVTYKIYEKKTISPTDLSCLNQDTNNKREVTLITCNTRRIDKTYAKSKRGIEFHLKKKLEHYNVQNMVMEVLGHYQRIKEDKK